MGSMKRFTEEWAIVATIDPDAYGTGDQTSDVIDMADFVEIAVIVLGGTLGSSATLDVAAKGDTASNGSFATTITGKSITQMTEAGTDSDKQAVISITQEDLMAQGYRYVRILASIAAAASDAAVLVLGRSAHYSPVADYDLASVDEILP